ncbi:MAG: biotin synthase BioB [Nitrospinota bacterium]|nr:biotin synthase BioB [Nitrospinota bacterium]
MKNFIYTLEEKINNGSPINEEDALKIVAAPDEDIYDIIASANRIRRKFKGERINLCSIINAKSGLCPEDCAFCSQSAKNNSEVAVYELVEKEKIVCEAKRAASNGAGRFGIVTSGKGVTPQDLNVIAASIEEITCSSNIKACASLGILAKGELTSLKKAGLKRYHHNLETAESFFPNICSSHSYQENIDTVRAAKEIGLQVCCGGIFGMGETNEQRVELALTLRELNVDSVPLNFLNPIKGTKMEGRPLLPPIEALKIIAMHRFILPDKDIKAAGGRSVVLRDLQSLLFAAGANSMMVGDYLTTKGRQVSDDIQMVADLGLKTED